MFFAGALGERRPGRDTVNDLVGLLMSIAPVLLPLMWCNARDRRRQGADALRADMSAAASRVLGGESMIAIHVEPALGWRPGRVRLSAPGEDSSSIARVTRAVIDRLPAGYELVVQAAPARG
jgi:hypothetical protein